MPFKHNAARHHRIPRPRYRVTNWPAYEAGLRRRGDLTLWLDEAALAGWAAPKRCTPGGQPLYADLAIELVLTLRLVFHLALRQAEAFARSVLTLLGLELRVPDHSTLSRRGRAFAACQPRCSTSNGPMHLVLDSTGLGLLGQGEWDTAKHGRVRRRWLKLHVAVDADTGEIAAHMLTEGHADDAAQVPDLLRQPEGVIASVIADGAYDGEPVYQAAAAFQPGRPPTVVIPPRALAVPSTDDPDQQSQRDRHIQIMAERGRIGWQHATGYGRRNLVETAIGRYKHLIGPKLRARSYAGQQGEVALAVQVLNRMIREAKPVTIRRHRSTSVWGHSSRIRVHAPAPYLSILAGVGGVFLLACLSPGPSFVVISSTAIAVSRRAGMLIGLGVAASTLTWATAVMLGLGLLLAQAVWLYEAIKLAGAAYLIWLGVRMIFTTQKRQISSDMKPVHPMTAKRYISKGYLLSVSNPTAAIYFLFGILGHVATVSTNLGLFRGRSTGHVPLGKLALWYCSCFRCSARAGHIPSDEAKYRHCCWDIASPAGSATRYVSVTSSSGVAVRNLRRSKCGQ